MEQFCIYFLHRKDQENFDTQYYKNIPDDFTLQRVMETIDRFKRYTILLSNDSLIRLMTSLVALSMNNLSVNEVDNGGTINHEIFNRDFVSIINSAKNGALEAGYFDRAIAKGFVSVSLKMLLDVAKVNACRISSIWQMVTSHIRMMASMKVSVKLLIFCFLDTKRLFVLYLVAF
jgi:hypothetical protein